MGEVVMGRSAGCASTVNMQHRAAWKQPDMKSFPHLRSERLYRFSISNAQTLKCHSFWDE